MSNKWEDFCAEVTPPSNQPTQLHEQHTSQVSLARRVFLQLQWFSSTLLSFKIQKKNLRKLCYSQLLGYVNAELPWNLTLILGQLRADGYFQSPWLRPRQIPHSQRQWDTAVCRSSSCSRISFHYSSAVKTVQDCLFLLFSVLLMKCSDLAQCPSCLEYTNTQSNTNVHA